jgi:hypothetical protein
MLLSQHQIDFVLILGQMDFIQRFFLYLSILAASLLLVGLFKPWMMLWWEDTQNRKKVIKLYATAALISYVLYWCTNLMLPT